MQYLKLKNKYIAIFFILLILFCFTFPVTSLEAKNYNSKLKGKILIQVEENGEAWYVYPKNGHRYFLGRPKDAFEIMKNLSLGAKHDFIINTSIFPSNLAGLVLLDVEENGEAYYIYPDNLKKYYLGKPLDAFNLMRNLGLGIKNDQLLHIPTAKISDKVVPDEIEQSFLIENVPFTIQAPFSNWQDKRQQDGCEESSALMTIKWAREESLSKTEAVSSILSASDYLLEKYGEYRDISSTDTVDWIFKDFFKYNKVAIKYNIQVEDIIYELSQGNLVITPMNGQIMNNPYFTPPGPPRHMIVIRGYDKEKNIFITNDPGTRHGENYEYDAKVLFEAIRDYPTGYHEPINEIERNMIVVWR